jgi:hypothetical protein
MASRHHEEHSMAGNAQDTWSLDEEDVAHVCLDEARKHDEFWRRQHERGHALRAGLDYEDYAPAYCVGYIGHAQYGGAFGDAEKSMISNWMRIKGDSRLTLEEAQSAMRAAWDRSEALSLERAAQASRDTQAMRDRAAQTVREQLERFVESAASWFDGVEERLLGNRPATSAHQRAE